MTTEPNGLRNWTRPASFLFRALSNETGLKVLCHLLEGEKTTEQLAKLTGSHKMKVVPHLSRLERFNLVTSRREGRNVFYSLTSEEAPKVLDAANQAFAG